MATPIRPKDIPTTASSVAVDDYFIIDGATNGTRKVAQSNAIASVTAVQQGLQIQRRSITANLTLVETDLSCQVVIPDNNRDVILPAEGANKWQFLLKHGGSSYTLTVKRAGGTTVATMAATGAVAVGWDGVAVGIC